MDAFVYRTHLLQYRRWVDKRTLCGHVVRDSHDQKSNFCSQHEPNHLIRSPWNGFSWRTELCGQAHLPSLTPDPHQLLFWKSKCFLVVYPQTTFRLNGELAFDFPELLQGCTLFCEAKQGAPIPGLPASQTALQGVVVVVEDFEDIWEVFLLDSPSAGLTGREGHDGVL